MSLFQMGAVEAVAAIQAGEISSEELVTDCLARINEIEETLGAWAHLDAEHALAQARAADQTRQAGHATGSLHGVPVGVKDIFDTQDMPTEDGTALHAGRTPGHDAAVVSKLREAGAVILGKTVTTEMAYFAPGKTVNPHDPRRTPGGSSSGSAAAVAAFMVPLSIGTQTNGSVIRPASFCGVHGYKPTHGLISRHRVLQQSRTLDQVGVFARGVADVALTAEQLIAFDERDPDTKIRAHPKLLETAIQEPPMPPRLALVKSPVWNRTDNDMQEAFLELAEHLSDAAEEVELPDSFKGAHDDHKMIMEADFAKNFEREYANNRDKLSQVLRETIERGRKVLAFDYNYAQERREQYNHMLNEILKDYDAIMTPAAIGQAPIGLETTGNPVFSTIWTLCGVPAISLPLLQGADGMPMGVQLVSARGDDARLLRTAAWLERQIEE